MMFKNLFKSKKQYLFSEPESTACMTCSHVLSEGKDIVYVTHDADDGIWQFLCGAENHEEEHAKIIGLGEIVSLDQTINGLYEMPTGVGALREAINEKWQPFKLES